MEGSTGSRAIVRSIEDNYYTREAPYLPSNPTLLAKLQTVVIRDDAFARLQPRSRGALRAAVEATIRHANPEDERSEVRSLCQQGLRPVQATPPSSPGSVGRSLRLERDPGTRSAIEAIEKLKRIRQEPRRRSVRARIRSRHELQRRSLPAGNLRDDDHRGRPRSRPAGTQHPTAVDDHVRVPRRASSGRRSAPRFAAAARQRAVRRPGAMSSR